MATQRYKSTPEDERIAQDENAKVADRHSAIQVLASDRIYEMEPAFVRLLSDLEPIVRSAAINALLAYWKKPDHLKDGLRMLHADPQPMARRDAAFALSQFLHRNNEASKYREQVIKELVRSLEQDEDWAVQKRCYESLLELLAPEKLKETREVWDEREKKIYNLPAGSRQWEFTELFDRSRDVDWELLKPYMDTARMLKV